MTHRALFPSPVHRRLAPLTAAAFFGGVALWVPVEKLFLAEIGFTPQTIGVMAAAYAAVVPLLEIPSGILADRWSRRGVLLIGNAGMVLSVVVGGLSTNVTTYVIAALLLGVYFAMQSGTFDAVVYDTVLEETGDSDAFESIIGRVRMVESTSLVLGALGGGALAALTTSRATYFATVPFLLASTAFLLAFREPRLHEVGETRSLREHVSITFGVIRHNHQLLPVAGLLVLTSILTQAVFEFGPLWLVDGGAGAGAFGPAWAGLMASLGVGGALAGRVHLERFTTRVVFVAAAPRRHGHVARQPPRRGRDRRPDRRGRAVGGHRHLPHPCAARRRLLRRAIGRRLRRRRSHLGDLHPLRDRLRRDQPALERPRRRVAARRPCRRDRIAAHHRHQPRFRRRAEVGAGLRRAHRGPPPRRARCVRGSVSLRSSLYLSRDRRGFRCVSAPSSGQCRCERAGGARSPIRCRARGRRPRARRRFVASTTASRGLRT